jgi:hypothetical protein
MCVKTTAPVKMGDEILVDYGSYYFERELADSQADSDSASDYERERRGPKKLKRTPSNKPASLPKRART